MSNPTISYKSITNRASEIMELQIWLIESNNWGIR